MSGQEHAPSHERHEQFKATPEKQEAAPRQERHESEPQQERLAPVAELSKKAAEEAVIGNELPLNEKATADESSLVVNRELHDLTWNRSITRIRKKLPLPEKALSKVIHQPVVNAVSGAAGKTVARPSGVLMGSIFAFLGSSFFLYASKHYGFRYNYLMFLLFFVGGFFVGLIVEAITWPLRRKQKA